MKTTSFDLLTAFAADPTVSWSIGAFGSIGEFHRDADEPASFRNTSASLEVVTGRGGLRIAADGELPALAWDSLSSDGVTWSHGLAICGRHSKAGGPTMRPLGPDHAALRPQDKGAELFDLGVTPGAVRMCARTRDPALMGALTAAEGAALFATPALVLDMLRAQPHRVMLSPIGRIEVFQPIPPPDGRSPSGPHTHLSPKLIEKSRTHSANVPIPQSWQPLLNVHPASPWRTAAGVHTPYDPIADRAFATLLERFESREDRRAREALSQALADGVAPEAAPWPASRRGRTKGRILLRRLAAVGDPRAASWRAFYDRTLVEAEEPPEDGVAA